LFDSYQSELAFEGNRAIVFRADERIPERVVVQGIAASLIYRLTRKESV
jgi:hypothetical protein